MSKLPDNVFDTLERERASYPAIMDNAMCVELLNTVAWIHRVEGWGLTEKTFGKGRGLRYDGKECSHDTLLNNNTGLIYDVLDAAGGTLPGQSKPVQGEGRQHTQPDRPFVAPIMPEHQLPAPGPGPTPPTPPPPTPGPGLKNRLVFANEFRQVNEFYAAPDGLRRTGGMIIGAGQWAWDTLNAFAHGEPMDLQQVRAAAAEVVQAKVDIVAMAQWGYDLMIGRSVDDVLTAIRNSEEWAQKHPGQRP